MKLCMSWPFYDKSLYEEKWNDNRGYATIILNAIRIIQATPPLDESEVSRGWIKRIKIEVSKASRLYVYIDNNKYFSCLFPFAINKKEEEFRIQYKNIKITDKLLSEAFGLLNDIKEESFYDRYHNEEEETNYSKEAYLILEKLITTEPSYVRYDYDAKNAKSHIHPLIHLDVNMSKTGTFKLGIAKHMPEKTFEDVFNKNVNCFYLVDSSRIELGLSNLKRKKVHGKSSKKGKGHSSKTNKRK